MTPTKTVSTPGRRASRELASLAREGLPCVERRTRGASSSPGEAATGVGKAAVASQERPRSGEAGGGALPSEDQPRAPKLRQATLAFPVLKPEIGECKEQGSPASKRRRVDLAADASAAGLPSRAIAAVAAALAASDEEDDRAAKRALFASPPRAAAAGLVTLHGGAVTGRENVAIVAKASSAAVVEASSDLLIASVRVAERPPTPEPVLARVGPDALAASPRDELEAASAEERALELTGGQADGLGLRTTVVKEEVISLDLGSGAPDGAEAKPLEGAEAKPLDGAEAKPLEGAEAKPLDGAEAKPPASPSPLLDMGALPPALAAYPLKFVELAAAARHALGRGRGVSAHLRTLMRTGLLAGARVRFQTKVGRVLIRGQVDEEGLIACECPSCGGARHVSPSEFEEHSGSKDRRPADGIFLEEYDLSVKTLLSLINSAELGMAVAGGPGAAGAVGAAAGSALPRQPGDLHGDSCYACGQGGDLLCCDGCTTAWHLACVGLEAVPEGSWFCKFCVADGVPQRAAAAAQATPGDGARRRTPRALSGRVRYDAGEEDLRSARRRGSTGGATPGGGRRPGRPPGDAARAAQLAALASPPGAAPALVPGRVRMAAPQHREVRFTDGAPASRGARNQNKHRRLFDGTTEGGLRQGDELVYRTAQGDVLRRGTAVVSLTGPSGILCDCCGGIVSCSQFEAHAGRAQRRQPYENIYTAEGIPLKQLALLLPELGAEDEDGGDGGEDEGEAVVLEGDGATGGCVLCHVPDFQRGGFGPKTIMICDQCEREFHVGCLADSGLASLTGLPKGDWFCSPECRGVHARLRARVRRGVRPVRGHPGHSLQLLRGRDGSPGAAWALRAAQELLQESFDPILDAATGADLLPLMLLARAAGEWDYKGVHTLLLRHRGKPVVAATARVFGPAAAELPLIATRFAARRQGHARVLVDAFVELLADLGVRRLVLPAAHETVDTWKRGFGFAHMHEDELKLYRRQLHILVFPGTEVLVKPIPGARPPPLHHVLRATPDPALHTIASTLSDMIQQVEDEDDREAVAEAMGAVLGAALDGADDPWGPPRPSEGARAHAGALPSPLSLPRLAGSGGRVLRRHRSVLGLADGASLEASTGDLEQVASPGPSVAAVSLA